MGMEGWTGGRLRGERHELTMKFGMAGKLLKRHVEKRASGTGVYQSQHRLLMHLFFTPECSQAELAGQLDISPAAVAVSLKKLERGGYIRRRNRTGDSRRNYLEITQQGMRVVDVSITLFDELDHILYGGFSSEEISRLGGFLDRMCANLCAAEEVPGEEAAACKEAPGESTGREAAAGESADEEEGK